MVTGVAGRSNEGNIKCDQMRNQERLLGVVAFTKMERSREEYF